MIRGKLRMQRNAHQSAFAGWLNIRHGEERLGSQLAILVNANAAGALGKKHAAIRRPDNRPGHFQIADNRFNSKTYASLCWILCRRLLRRRLHFAGAAAGRRLATRRQEQEKRTGQEGNREKGNG